METKSFICSIVVLAVLQTAQSKPPKIIEPVKKMTDDIFADTEHTLSCSVEDPTGVKYRWTFDNSPDIPSDVTVDENNGELKIPSFTDEHEGNYQCIAESDAVAMSPVVTLRKIRIGQEWPGSSNWNVSGDVGDYFKLTCDNPPESVPTAQYSWYLAEGQESEGEVKPDDRIYIDEQGTLHFMYLEESDQSDNLRYKCAIFNSQLGIIKLGSEKSLWVNSGDVSEKAPISQFHTNPAKFLKTKEAELECVFSGYPIPTITWFYKSDKEISIGDKYDIVDNTRKLIVKGLIEEDEGIYTCIGRNAGGDVKTKIYLDVTSGPIWVESLSSQTVLEGKNAVFKCRARQAIGDSELNAPTWLKNGEPLTVTNDPKFEFSNNSRVLTVMNLNKTTDIMCFQCNVSNEIGYEFGDGCLNVIKPIVVISQPDLKQEVTKGGEVNLTVVGKTDPAYTLSYRWHFRNETYEGDDSPPFVVFNQTTMQAYINTSDLSDEDFMNISGTYIREMYHLDDRLNVSIVVSVVEEPVVIPVVAAAVNLWWIALIVALVILIIVIIIIVVICHRKRQEGFYPLDKKERLHDIDPEKDLADSGFHDLSRAPNDDEYPDKKYPHLIDDDMYSDDENAPSSHGGEDAETTFFNEDGSFIGKYGTK